MLKLMVEEIFYLLIQMINGFLTFNSFPNKKISEIQIPTFFLFAVEGRSFPASCATTENYNEEEVSFIN